MARVAARLQSLAFCESTVDDRTLYDIAVTSSAYKTFISTFRLSRSFYIAPRWFNMTVDELIDTVRNTTLNDSALLFSPHLYRQWSRLKLNPIPRFLFRVYTPRSDGFTNETVASSRDAASELHGNDEDIFATNTPAETAKLVADHLWWTRDKENERRRDNLVSWSSSMLFLIRYIFYRHYDSADESHLGDIHLLVVDTEAFPPHTFIRDSDLIQAFKRFDNRKQDGLLSLASLRDARHYFGEYLSQGSLQISGKCSTTSAHTLVLKGLLDLNDIFRNAYEGVERDKWVKPVLNARDAIRAMPKTQPASLALLDKVFDIALEFGEAWRLPVAVHLLALLPCGLDPRAVHERLSIRLSPTSEHMYASLYKWKITRLIDDDFDRCATYWQTIHAPQVMPELTRGQSIMEALFVMNVRCG